MNGEKGIQGTTNQGSPSNTHAEEEVAKGEVGSKDEGHLQMLTTSKEGYTRYPCGLCSHGVGTGFS